MKMYALRIICFVCCLLFAGISASPVQKSIATEFIVLHNNDMHARFEQTNVNSGKCTEEDAKANKCYGGFARVANVVRKYRTEALNGGLPVLYLNAGDTYTGTAWFTVFKDNITAAFLNILQPDAISLGNHEFDENVAGLIPFLNEVDFPVLACNLDLSKVPEMLETKRFGKSTVLDVKGTKVGIIGYLTPDTKILTPPNDVEYISEIEAINLEADILKNSGVNIIIALGHSGYQKDQEIALRCPLVDVVIGGHTNTFLYNGDQPDAERIDGPYPTYVKQSTGKLVPVVQAYAYTKYLGKLHLQFDENGDLLEIDGMPILLDSSVSREADVLDLLEVYRPNITELENSVVGHTKVFLMGSASVCRTTECNLGNLIADSMVHARVLEDMGGLYWTDAPIALIGGGGIRSSIEKRSDGSITKNDVFTVLPFENDLYVAQVSGEAIHKSLEHSATIRSYDSNGGFLQMSGVQAVYDYNKEEGSRVTSVKVLCAECIVPAYEDLKLNQTYKIVIQKFLMDGGDGHDLHDPNAIPLKVNDKEALIQYLQQRDYVYPEIENRLTIIEPYSDSSASFSPSIVLFSSLLLCLLSIFK